MNEIYGIDFSGAADGGRKVWICKLIENGKSLVVDELVRAADLPSGATARERALPAVVEYIKNIPPGSFVGCDFPFSLPRELIKEKTWLAFIAGLSDRYENSNIFRNTIMAAAGDRELKRETETESKTPFSSYNLRLFRQTYHGINEILKPLVESKKVRVLPMQKHNDKAVSLIEVCPASTLKAENLYTHYKGRDAGDRAARKQLLENMEKMTGLKFNAPNRRQLVVQDPEGDAIDSMIAALTARAARKRAVADSASRQSGLKIEGRVYYQMV